MKKPIFAKSPLTMNQEVAKYADWNEAAVKARQADLEAAGTQDLPAEALTGDPLA